MNSIDTESFASSQRLHTSQHNSNKRCFRKKPYQCYSCDKSFSTEIVLSEHEQTHKGGIFSCYTCGEVAPTLTKMVAHMRIHFIETQTLSLGETDSFLDVSYELNEIEPISNEVDDVMVIESSMNQMPKKDNVKELISNESKKKNAKDITHKIKNTQAGKEATENQNITTNSEENTSLSLFKTVKNNFYICNTSETMKGKENIVNNISNINKSKGTNRNKKQSMVKMLNNLNDGALEEKKHNDNEKATIIASTISDTKNTSICENVENQENIIVDILNESDVQYSKNEKNGSINKKEISTEVGFANNNIINSNFNIKISQISSKQENQNIPDIEESPQNNNDNVKKIKKEHFILNSVKIDIVKFNCDQCDFESKYRSNLRVHKKRHQLKELIKCQHCNFKSKYKGSLDKHRERHMLNECKAKDGNNNVHQEGNINKNKKNQEKRKNKKKSPKLKKYININKKCDGLENTSLDSEKIYNEIINSESDKSKNIKNSPSDKKEKSNKITYKCKNCDYKCQIKFRMKMHSQTHSIERPFHCPYCEYRTKFRGTLRVHIRIHTGEKPYSCSECDYRCTTSTSLKKHVMIHTGEKPLKCSLCEYRCIQGNALKAHIKMHSEEKPLKCSLCDYRCIQSNALKAHIKTHSGEKPLQCSLCDYRCIQGNALKAHIKTHFCEKSFKCSQCSYKCKRKNNFQLHVDTHKGQK